MPCFFRMSAIQPAAKHGQEEAYVFVMVFNGIREVLFFGLFA